MLKNTLTTPEQDAPEQKQSSVAVRAGGAAGQNTVRNIGLIVGREYKNRVSQRSFIITTIIILVLVVIGTCVPTIIQYFTSKSSSQTKVVVVNNAGTIGSLSGDTLNNYLSTTLNGSGQAASANSTGQSTNSTPNFTITGATANSVNSLQQKVKDGSLDILLIIDRGANQSLHFIYYTNSSPTDTTLSQVQGVAGQLSFLDKTARLGLTPAQTSSLFVQPEFTVITTKPNQDTRSTGDIVASYIIAYVGIILIFMSVYLYGIGVATGVAEEKGSRIMEILVNAATPFQLMVGKIIGIGAAGLTQMACFVVVGISALLLQNPLKSALLGTNAALTINITGPVILLLVLLLVYFILGFLLYATLFAAMGALVKRQDEVQNVIQPITWLFMVGYIISFVGISNPNATWVKVISYIPFWTPTTMLMRVGAGSVAGWEIALTIVLMTVAIFVCAIISARIYRFGVLMYGQKPGLGQLLKMVSSKQ